MLKKFFSIFEDLRDLLVVMYYYKIIFKITLKPTLVLGGTNLALITLHWFDKEVALLELILTVSPGYKLEASFGSSI